MTSGLNLIPKSELPLKPKDFTSNQEVRWCPGCGDYAILAGVRTVMANSGIDKDHMVVISGIGCSSRFPYYVDSYGMHSIHGRAPAIATGLAVARPDLAVFIVTGDGDALSIGGNHLIHALRRNINVTILLFNNEIYGLTKGQYSPTSRTGKNTKSSPMGAIEKPFNPVALALGAGATFVARTIDSARKHLVDTITQAANHPGAALVEIAQNCPIFNDGAWEDITGSEADKHLIDLQAGEKIIFGAEKELCAVSGGFGGVKVANVADVNEEDILIHDPSIADPTAAFALAQLDNEITTHGLVPIGVYRKVEAPAYDRQIREQVDQASNGQPVTTEKIQKLITGSDTWTV